MSIICDLFTLDAQVKEAPEAPLIRYEYRTDLPCGTQVILSCHRKYLDHNDQECLWTMRSERISVTRTSDGDLNGGSGEIDVNEADESALRRFEETLDQFSAGIKEPVGDEVWVELTVGGRQRLRAFGAGNRNLTGSAVLESRAGRYVESAAKVVVPMLSKYQPISE